MYVIIWEYQVKVDRINEFEKVYNSNGAWAELFRKGNGYFSTELLHDETQPQRYITIDRWDSAQEYAAFHAQFNNEYETLDSICEDLTERETLLGKWESVNNETR
ncbi:MAG: antibiotic biosynthesis monooxygenase [Anaerolineales bacterium]